MYNYLYHRYYLTSIDKILFLNMANNQMIYDFYESDNDKLVHKNHSQYLNTTLLSS